MNCLRSLNYIKKIDNKYRKHGLGTILIHPPEWEFEKQSKNIFNAVKKYKIKIPIIIDKERKIIKKLKVNFWPTQMLVRDEKILYRHVGEGSYKVLENNIIRLLKVKLNGIFEQEPRYSKFPTVYCGKDKRGEIKELNKDLKFGVIYKNNNWVQEREYIRSLKNNSSLLILTKGNIINFVAESLNKKLIKVGIKLDDKNIRTTYVNKPQLYNIIKLKNSKPQKLSLITSKNIAIYSFSFQ